jgi:hypothetical protein
MSDGRNTKGKSKKRNGNNEKIETLILDKKRLMGWNLK